MLECSETTTTAAALVLCLASVVIVVFGTRLARVADELSDLTGLGEAVFGAILLGGATSSPGILASVTAAAEGYPALATSNAIGGIAAQTAFLAIADLTYRRANLEHASASLENLVQGVLLVGLLAGVAAAATGPVIEIGAVHPATVLLLVGYVLGQRLAARTGRAPLWVPWQTPDTSPDVPDTQTLRYGSLGRSWTAFVLLGGVVGVAGYFVAQSGIVIARRTGLSETIVGTLFTAVSTSLPELVTCVAAVRRGAPTLAVAGIIGGNTFDVLFIAVSDLAYRPGSIYHAIGSEQLFLIAMAAVSTSVLVLGMLHRERRGIANIGFESLLVLVLYGVTILALFLLS